MRQTISGLVAAIAVVTVSAAPAMASCYSNPCGVPQVYVSPAPVYSGCDTGCGWARERLPDPVQQYYYVNQGPVYSGPGNWAPQPTYQESAVSGWNAYRNRPYYYGYDGGRYANALNHRYDGAPNVEGPAVYSYRAHRHHRPWRAHSGYHQAPRYGYAPRHYHHGMRYAAPRHHGHYRHERVLRRYY